MIRVNITAEGFSEERFIEEILRPHLLAFGVYVEVRKILTNRKLKKRGGMPSYEKVKNDIKQWIKESPGVWHTTMIDLYGLKNDFPGYSTTSHMRYDSRAAEIERQFGESIDFHKFIPYIQLHEYEALLFSDPDKMEEWLGLYNDIPKGCFRDIRDGFESAEQINDSKQTAPSKRIESIVGKDNYSKVDDGVLILKEIGLEKIRKECPHFDDWLIRLENLGTTGNDPEEE
ncbi:MAG TPA: DUF4276 family protein [Bacteroidetes bacterium]|nr:DUF4276 family protein [Bacteroidota bacterium]